MSSELDPEVPVPRALHWCNTQLRTKGRREATEVEFETVLTALERQQAIMLLEEGGRPLSLVFTA